MTDAIAILASARTPIGGLQGNLSSLSAAQLGAAAIAATMARSEVNNELVQEAIIGNVLSAGQGQAPARQAVLGADLPQATPCTTINKMCGSGMKATMLAHDLIKADVNNVMIAGGMESMSQAPYLLKDARQGQRMGHGNLIDHMFLDGLEDAYDKGKLMGVFAEQCAAHYHFSREQQDQLAIESLNRALAAAEHKHFAKEICAIEVTQRKNIIEVSQDQQPQLAQPHKIPHLRPAFQTDGTVTAANASSISDGAAALLLSSAKHAEAQGWNPVALIRGHSSFAHAPQWFTTAPVHAINKLLTQLQWRSDDVDLYEINEAFAVVTMAAIKELRLDPATVNINGGACALGHPIGASGARILVTLIHSLQQRGLRRGIAALCIGGGEATAMAVELV